ncbi:MAG: hypothetical protein KAS12_05015 [Candidatus Aenigmarchaeota archaeon]|nr:hypothetical protein [Candidatus Aenigmarchaeota archaeon]
MIKKILFIVLIISLFYLPFIIQASAIPTVISETETETEAETESVIEQIYSPHLLPGQPLYFLKGWWEKIRLFLISDPIGKINYSINLIRARLAESKTLLEQQKITQAEANNERYQFQINKTLEQITQLKSDSQQTDRLNAEVAEETIRHQEVLMDVYGKVPEVAKQGVLNTINRSEQGYQQATNSIDSAEIKENLTKQITQIKSKLQLFLQNAGIQSRQQIKKGLGVLEKETTQGLENLGIIED